MRTWDGGQRSGSIMNRTVGAVACVLGAACAAAAGEARMEDRQVAALREMMAAVNAGDAARYARLYAEDASITIHGSGELQGRAAIEAHEFELLRQFPGARLAFYDAWQKDPLAVVHYAVNGQTRAGQPMGHEGLLFYRFQPSGLIAEERRYLDSLTPMAQLGALGHGPLRAIPQLPAELKAHRAAGSREETDNVLRVESVLAAIQGGDEASFAASLAPDAVIDDMLLPEPFRAPVWYRYWAGAFRGARSQVTSRLGAGDSVLLETKLDGVLDGTFGRVSGTRRTFSVHRALVVRLQGGKVVRMLSFVNGKELAQAVGQWPPAPPSGP